MMNLKPREKKQIEAIQQKISKLGFRANEIICDQLFIIQLQKKIIVVLVYILL
jgi:hypothetical protein